MKKKKSGTPFVGISFLSLFHSSRSTSNDKIFNAMTISDESEKCEQEAKKRKKEKWREREREKKKRKEKCRNEIRTCEYSKSLEIKRN